MNDINYEVYSVIKYDDTRWGIWDRSIDDWYDVSNPVCCNNDIRQLEELADLLNINHNTLTDFNLFR